MHLKPTKKERSAAEANLLISIVGGGGVGRINSMGVSWAADYLKISGQPEVDIRNNIAAEARAKITYERLLNFCEDPGSKDALTFLMTREIAHMKSFMLALDSLGKDPLEIGQIPPDPKFVNKYYNDSTGTAARGIRTGSNMRNRRFWPALRARPPAVSSSGSELAVEAIS